MRQYSEDFEKEFLEVLSRRHGTKRVRASQVYNEFIAHKTHTHMNSTQWETLTSFVLYLGKVRDRQKRKPGVFERCWMVVFL